MRTPLPVDVLTTVLTRGLKAEPPAPGDYPLRGLVTVLVDCTVSKAADVDARPAYKVDWPAVVALLLKRLKQPIERVRPLLDAALADAEKEPTRELELYQAAVKLVLTEQANKLEKEPRAGATKVAGRVEIVDFQPNPIDPLEPAAAQVKQPAPRRRPVS